MQRKSLTPLFAKPVIGDRLVLRKLQERDAQAFVESFAENDYEMRDFFIFPSDFEPDENFTTSVIFPAMKGFEKSKNMHYLGVFRTGSPDNMLGMVLCNQDQNNLIRSSYFIKESERRKGYGAEMYSALMDAMAVRTDQKIMYAEVDKNNTASLKMLRSLGFEMHGIHRATNNKHDDRKMIALSRSI